MNRAHFGNGTSVDWASVFEFDLERVELDWLNYFSSAKKNDVIVMLEEFIATWPAAGSQTPK